MPEEYDPFERVRLTVFMPLWLRNALKKYVVEEDISMSQWMANQAEKAVIAAGFKPPAKLQYGSLSELVKENRENILTQSRLTESELDQVIKVDACDEVTLLRIAMALDVSEEEIRRLVKHS